MKIFTWGLLLMALAVGGTAAATPHHLMFSTEGSVSLPGGVSAEDEDAVFFEVSSAEAGGTGGDYTETHSLDMSNFAPFFDYTNANIDAIHYVTRPVVVYTTQSQFVDGIPAGSVLVSFDTDGLSLPTDSTMSVSLNGVNDEDIYLFIPDVVGDLSAGTWVRFFDGADTQPGLTSTNDQHDVDGICLIEQDMTVLGIPLSAGDVLMSLNGIPPATNARASDIIIFRGTRYGNSTQGYFDALPLYQGPDENMDWPGPPDESLEGFHLLQNDALIGDETVPAGSILLTIAGDSGDIGNPSDITPDDEDVFLFSPTSLGGGASLETQGTFSNLLLGSSTEMGLSGVGVDALTLVTFPVLSAETTSVDLNGGDIEPGDVIEWTIQVRNSAPAHATGVVVSSTIPASMENPVVIDVATGADASTGETIAVTDLVISPETTIAVVWQTTVEAAATDGFPISLTGTVSAAAEGGSGTSYSEFAGIVVLIVPDVSTSNLQVVDVNGGDVMPGDTLAYTLTLSNTASQEATGVDVTGTIHTDTENLTITDNGGGNDTNSTSTFLDIRDLTVPSMGDRVLTWTVAVQASVGEAVPITMDIATTPPAEGGVGLNLSSNTVHSIPVELSIFTVE